MQKQGKQNILAEEARQIGIEYDNARRKLEEMQSGRTFYTSDHIKQQQTDVSALEKEWDKVRQAADKLQTEIYDGTQELGRMKTKAGELYQQIGKAGSESGAMAHAMDRMQKSANRFSLRLREVVRSALIFTVISQGLASLRNWLGKVIQSNADASAAIARLKGALLTLAQPLLDVVIPAFITLVNILTQIVSVVAQLISMLFGKTITQSKEAAEGLNSETKALEGVGAAAEEASGSLAGFDEINTISTQKNAGGGGVGASTMEPDFGFDANMGEGQLQNILDLIKAIGSALLAWKIGKSLGLSLKNILLLFLAIYSAATFLENLFSAWTGGVTLSNTLGMIASALATALFLFLALGKTLGPIAAGISLIVTGLAMLVTGFHDAMENGWNFENLLLSIAGILAAGLGIAILTGSWIPLLVAGIASLLLAFTVATGHGEELLNGIRQILQGFLDFFTGIFTGDIELAISGVEQIFDGLGTAIGAVFDGLIDTILSFLNWLDEKTGGVLSPLLNFIKDLFSSVFGSVKDTVLNVIEAMKTIFTGIVQFVSGVFTQDWDMAWEGVKNIFKGVWNGIVSIIESAINLIVRGVNKLLDGLQAFTSFELPEWLGGYSFGGINIPRIPKVSIPRLAAGAVIPPNREFMAVLGDQTRGTNIEAPESLIRKIVREESGNMNTELLQAILEAIRAGQVIKVNETVLGRTSAKAINKVTRSSGKSVLLY
nr:MAG TPA: minor tail protein [Bacteriophage sp.]